MHRLGRTGATSGPGRTSDERGVSAYRVVVLAGGLSPERDVSLHSGRRVADALLEAGHEATVRDVDASLLDWLATERPDCAIPLLHGDAGEGGALQEVLELADI